MGNCVGLRNHCSFVWFLCCGLVGCVAGMVAIATDLVGYLLGHMEVRLGREWDVAVVFLGHAGGDMAMHAVWRGVCGVYRAADESGCVSLSHCEDWGRVVSRPR